MSGSYVRNRYKKTGCHRTGQPIFLNLNLTYEKTICLKLLQSACQTFSTGIYFLTYYQIF